MLPRYLDNIPSEIVSEIILKLVDSFGDNTYLKWRVPLLVRRVSKRFYHITNDTRSAWRYIYIRRPLHPYLQSHIERSAPHPLVVDAVYYHGMAGVWGEMIDLILLTFPRLRSLVFHSLSDNSPIRELLRHQMPVLKLLDVRGLVHTDSVLEICPSRIPALQHLRSVDCFPFHTRVNLPETLEGLHIGSWRGAYRAESLWDSLPKSLRLLQVEGIGLWGLSPNRVEKIRLPCLNVLHLYNCHSNIPIRVLPFLDTPCLQTLTMELKGEGAMQVSNFTDWFIGFPELTHLEWRFWQNSHILAHKLQRCYALKSLSIKPMKRLSGLEASILDFVEALAGEPSLLPLLESLLILGASLASLRKLVLARPGLVRLEVHRSDLRPDLASEWMPSNIEFRINHCPTFDS